MTEVFRWLSTPLSGASEHFISSWASWHGRLMVLAWGFAIPLGIIAARYFKIPVRANWPQKLDHKAWWHIHRLFQYAGMTAACFALFLAWQNASGESDITRLHGLMGWAVMALGFTQIASGLLRGSKGGPPGKHAMAGDHYNMTPRRIVFEYVHKFGGLVAQALGIATILVGLFVADAPRWMLVILLCWWAVLITAVLVFQRQGRCIDTYQAIWGADLHHPGSQRKLIGWGNVRITEHDNS